jgi:hypothetical protein
MNTPRIIAIIADDLRPEGWQECYTAKTWDASHVDHRNQVERLIHRFNSELRPGELPRRLISLTSEEIDEADAFNMGMGAYNFGGGLETNYWPAGHANHQAWQNGWEAAQELNERDYEA